MQKLIKISIDEDFLINSKEQYVVVDNSEIKEKDFMAIKSQRDNLYYLKQCNIIPYPHPHSDKGGILDNGYRDSFKVTHSFGIELEGVENRPLSEAQEIEYGYSVEKMAEKSFGHKPNKEDTDIVLSLGKGYINGFKQGFNAHKELVKNKIVISKNKLEDILYALLNCEKYEDGTFSFTGADQYRIKKTGSSLVRQFIKPLMPSTEWEVEFVNGKIVKI